MPLPSRHDFYDSVPSYSHLNESQKKLNIKVNSQKSGIIQNQQALLNCSGVKGKAQLVQNVLDARKKRATQQFEKQLPLQSFASNINVTNSLKKQPEEHRIDLIQMHTERSKCNKQTLSENNNKNKLKQSGNIPQPLSNVENSDFENSMYLIDNTENTVMNDVAVNNSVPNIHTNIPSKVASHFKHMELPQSCNKNIGQSHKSSFTSSEKENKIQGIHLTLSCHFVSCARNSAIRFTYLIC